MDYHTQLFFTFKKKKRLYLLTPLQHHNFHIDQCMVEEMETLKTCANWTPFVHRLIFKKIIHMLLYKPSIHIIYDKIIKIKMTIIYKYHTFHVFWKQKYNCQMSYKNS